MFSIISSYICFRLKLTLYSDFLILGLVIVFPITFSLREAFRRRERALEYLSLFKASLQSLYYSIESSKLNKDKKLEFKNIARNISELLIECLSKTSKAAAVQKRSHSIFTFIQANKETISRTLSLKIFFFVFRINDSIEFLLAVKRHRTPWGIRAVVLVAIYAFAIMYPASLLRETGSDATLGYLCFATGFKSVILISLYNVQTLLEDPFNQKGPDDIRLDDFTFLSGITADEAAAQADIIEKGGKPIQYSEFKK